MSDTPSGASRIHRLGLTSWALLGVILLLVAGTLALGAIRGILVPLVIAVIIGALLEPLVEALERRGLGPALAATIALLLALAAAAGTAAIVVLGFLEQLPQIYRQVMVGWNEFLLWGRSLDLDAVVLERIRKQVEQYAPQAAQGIWGVLSGTFSGVLSFGLGAFFAVFLLFFVLRDARRFPGWVARVASLEKDMVEEMATAVEQSLRGYFRGIAITAAVTAPIFMVPLLLLRVPLPIPIFILYFALSFIPFLGAWITGAFVVLIAFGSGGAPAALIMALTFLISNGTIQSAVSSWALGSALRIHPVAVLLATLIGGTIAGLIGMVLAAPLVAATIRSVAVVREHQAPPSADASVPYRRQPRTHTAGTRE